MSYLDVTVRLRRPPRALSVRRSAQAHGQQLQRPSRRQEPRRGWDVTRPDAARRSAHAETQQQAIDRARDIVRNAGGGEVVIHNQQGQIRDKDTIPPGNDPNPPRDRR
ncbi:DUF2188 domain-containing protein [Blastococcus brunescens]|uniref:DUF2188 domain-containing protein n=1 Tax=Blastococcus brunescens TaxID=1564165 RepID=A0ABZ1B7R6_9ACTN|nr:DUF2188 domain-containing protein [Blastococcus sp. BMG 8361]WRL66852.1 DUF2188 domain-containing protein [Blastococcus sp. BMG 8361]